MFWKITKNKKRGTKMNKKITKEMALIAFIHFMKKNKKVIEELEKK